MQDNSYILMKMEMNLSESFLPDNSWGLELPFSYSGGLFDDLKNSYDGEIINSGAQDAVEHVLNDSSKDEDVLDLEWMESSDLSLYFHSLGSSNDKLLLAETGLCEYMSLTAPQEHCSKEDPVSVGPSSSNLFFFQSEGINVAKIPITSSQFSLLSPPSSPEQVAPVMKLEKLSASHESLKETEFLNYSSVSSSIDLFTGEAFESLSRENLFEGLISSDVCESSDPVTFNDVDEFIGSALSADDVESMLSSSTPSSPASTTQNSIIEASPELYKVITTSSIEGSRFSPYPKSKAARPPKNTCTIRTEVDIVPDQVMEQLNKRDRKKLQNKNAAIRYRMKKKEEALDIKSEEQLLEELNEKLKTKVEDLYREIKYMKNLMEDVCRAKGLL